MKKLYDDKVFDLIKNVKTYEAFRRKYSGPYDYICRTGQIEKLRKLIPNSEKKPRGYWNKENISKEALKYKTRIDFVRGNQAAYIAAKRLKLLNEVCSHMEIIGNRYKRGIYAIEFPDNSAYIGLTASFNKRKLNHINKSHNKFVRTKMRLFKGNFNWKEYGYYDCENALKKEDEIRTLYSKNKWIILNEKDTGRFGLGGGYIRWTEDKINQVIIECLSPSDFQKNYSGAWLSASNQGILDELYVKMGWNIRKKRNFWTKENCLKEAKKYNSRTEFAKKSDAAYKKCSKNDWLKITFPL